MYLPRTQQESLRLKLSTDEQQPDIEHKTWLMKSALHHATIAAVSIIGLTLIACDKAPEPPAAAVTGQAVVGGAPAEQEPPLLKAATRGNLAKARELLDEGANVNLSNPLGRTPLHMSVFSGHPKTSGLLIERGANLEAKDRVGMTPLHAAVLGGDVQTLELILSKKPDIKSATDTGLTALHLAAATGQDQIVAILVRNGADPQNKDRDGRTPLFYALKNQHPSTVSLLQKY